MTKRAQQLDYNMLAFPFPTEHIFVSGEDLETHVHVLVNRSCWFVVTPHPDNKYEITAKPEGHLARAQEYDKQVKRTRSETAAATGPTRLVVFINGGDVVSICSNRPDEFSKVEVTVVDYDDDNPNYNNHVMSVPQVDGSHAYAIVMNRHVALLRIDLDKAVRVNGCDTCDVDTPGILPDASPHCGEPPKGFVVVERCDACNKYSDDLAAAKAWGTDAHWMANEKAHNHLQAVCRPPKEPINVEWKTATQMKCPTCGRMTHWYDMPSKLCEHKGEDGKKCKGSHKPTREVQDHWKSHGSES